MEASKRVVLCGGVGKPNLKSSETLELALDGPNKNVNLEISNISRRIMSDIPDEVVDLIEIATYVYCADQATTRGGEGVLNYGKNWRRNFIFHIPVRALGIWSSAFCRTSLENTLSFLSDDNYEFRFSKQKNSTPVQHYLTFNEESQTIDELDEVILFSGGLDSLGGAVAEAVRHQRRVGLVSHNASPQIHSKQKALVNELSPLCKHKPFHIPVWVHKDSSLTREYTQRSRSFLFASLAFAVAQAYGLERIKFYENGVISLNLPISEQVVGGRATRSTHPQVLNGFAKLFGTLRKKPFQVENPFLWQTKSEVINLIGDNGSGPLIKNTVSCMHTYELTKQHTHCGRCSQCISRRFSTLASRYGDFDPADVYKVDLLVGERKKGVDLTMLESFIRAATDLRRLNDYRVIEKYGEITRVVRHVNTLSADAVAEGILQVYRKHSEEVARVMDDAIKSHATAIREGKLPATCAIILSMAPRYRVDPTSAEDEIAPFTGHQHVAEKYGALALPSQMRGPSIERSLVARSIGSSEAVAAVRAYMDAHGWNTTEFAIQAQSTDRSIRKFLASGRIRRSTFESMANCMGLSKAQLLRGELTRPVSH